MDYKNSEEYKSFHYAYYHPQSEDGLLVTTILVAFIIVGWLYFN